MNNVNEVNADVKSLPNLQDHEKIKFDIDFLFVSACSMAENVSGICLYYDYICVNLRYNRQAQRLFRINETHIL